MAPTAACECDKEEQTVDCIIASCAIFHHPTRRLGLELVDEETVACLNNTCPNILRVFPKVTSTPYEKNIYKFIMGLCEVCRKEEHNTNVLEKRW